MKCVILGFGFLARYLLPCCEHLLGRCDGQTLAAVKGTPRDIEALRAQKLRARLILQVHDELIVEAPEDEAERVRALLRDCMEGVMRLSVPLRTDISVGRNWRECK